MRYLDNVLMLWRSALCFLVSSRSVCLDSVRTSTETGITTGRRIIWRELSATQECTMEIMNTTSHCCWQTSTKSECLKEDDAKFTHAVEWTPKLISLWFYFYFLFLLCPKNTRKWVRRSRELIQFSSFLLKLPFQHKSLVTKAFVWLCHIPMSGLTTKNKSDIASSFSLVIPTHIQYIWGRTRRRKCPFNDGTSHQSFLYSDRLFFCVLETVLGLWSSKLLWMFQTFFVDISSQTWCHNHPVDGWTERARAILCEGHHCYLRGKPLKPHAAL